MSICITIHDATKSRITCNKNRRTFSIKFSFLMKRTQQKTPRPNNPKYFAVPGPLVSPAVAVCGWCKVTSDLDPHNCYCNSNWSSSMQIKKSKFTFSGYLTSWPQMSFDLDLRPLTAWTYEGFHIISINQFWFKSDFNFSNEGIFTFSAYLTTWPQMTFDLDIWPLTSSTNEGSHVASMTQLCLKSIKACGR